MNKRTAIQALTDFSMGSLGLIVEDFQFPDTIIQLDYPPSGIDLIISRWGRFCCFLSK